MARPQRLRLTLKHVAKDRTWTDQWVEIFADPEDHKAIRNEIVKLARELDSRGGGDPWWADQYKGHIQGLEETWREAWVSGGA